MEFQIMKYVSTVVERLIYPLNITNLPTIESIILKVSKFQKQFFFVLIWTKKMNQKMIKLKTDAK